ncbi:hypothetical protein [Georgenia sp. SUBG003]|uniref:hypothetical protein n=1 Tax=Georgenia sp. SUBG003 TaxID=1497974 RepID=UPI003AB3B0D1
MGLERVGRVARLQAGLEHVLRGGAGTAGHRAVDELDVGVLLVEHPDEGVQAGLLRTLRPPGEHLDLAAAAPSTTAGGRLVPAVTAAARGENEAGGRDPGRRRCASHRVSPPKRRRLDRARHRSRQGVGHEAGHPIAQCAPLARFA